MTAEISEPAGVVDAPRRCAAHPEVETALGCSRCDTAICPRCLVQTPVGARCRSCAQLRRPPMYAVGPGSALRIVGAAIGLGVAIGLAWGLLLPGGGFGFFVLFLGGFAGYGMANLMDRASGRKRGPWVQGAAVAGVVLAYLVRNVVAFDALIVPNDLWGLIFIGIASAVAWNQLR